MIVTALFAKAAHQASRVACVRRSLALANSFPGILSTLSTTATPKQIVVQPVIVCRLRWVEEPQRRAFETNDDRPILGVGKDVTS